MTEVVDEQWDYLAASEECAAPFWRPVNILLQGNFYRSVRQPLGLRASRYRLVPGVISSVSDDEERAPEIRSLEVYAWSTTGRILAGELVVVMVKRKKKGEWMRG